MNSVDHKGFLMFLSHWELLSELPPAMFKRVMQAIFSAAGADCGMPENMELVERIAFTALSGDVQRSLDKYDERRRKCATAGSKGGRRRAENANANHAAEADVVTGTEEASDASDVQANASDASNVQAKSSDAWNGQANASDAWNVQANASDAWNVQAKSSDAWNVQAKSSDAWNSQANASDASNVQAKSSDASNVQANASDAWNSQANASDAWNVQAKSSDASFFQANQAKDKDKDKVTDKAKARAMDKENKKPLSVVDAAAPDQTAACAAGAAPHTETLPLSTAHTGPSHAQPSPKAVNAHFEALWALYPIKRGKNQVSKRAKRQLMDVDTAAMQTAIARYVAEVEASAFDRQWLNGSTWFNGRYLDYLGEGYVPPPESGAKPSARSRETSYRSAEEARACAARYAALEE